MRAFTFYEQIEPDQPGTPCRTFTLPHPKDLRNMRNDIEKLKQKVDLVIVSQHWGLHSCRLLSQITSLKLDTLPLILG